MFARLARWQCVVCALCTALLCLLSSHILTVKMQVLAQELSVARPVPIAGEVPDNSIISFDGTNYSLSSEQYDKAIMGVVTPDATIEYKSSDVTVEGTHPVISTGIATVRVTTANGPIFAGDTITSSDTPGVGVKATKSGFILGTAQADFTGEGEGKIPVILSIKFAFATDSPMTEKIRVQLTDMLKLSGLTILDDPIMSLRYVLATTVVVSSLVVTFLTVGKVARSGVDAVGRNPLASKAIMFSIIMNTILSIAIVGIGLTAAYFITAS
jgi:hypothetical protein